MGNSHGHHHNEGTRHSPHEEQLSPFVIDLIQRKLCGTEEHSQHIDKEAFHDYFSQPVERFGQLFYEHIHRHFQNAGEIGTGSLLTKQHVVDAIKKVLSLNNKKTEQIKFYCKIFSKEEEMLNQESSSCLVNAAFMMYMASSGYRYKDSEVVLDVFAHRLASCRDINALSHYIQNNCPELLNSMHNWVVSLCHGQANPNALHTISNEDYFQGSMLSHPLAWLLSCCISATYTVESTVLGSRGDDLETLKWEHWMTLYDSNSKGLSLNRLQHHVFNYKGPTIMLVTCTDDNFFAVAVDQEWQESTHHWGGGSCASIQLTPMFRCIEEGSDMMFLNEKSRTMPKGIIVGRNGRNPSFSIDSGLSVVTHSGGLQSNLEAIEIIGCGGKAAMISQAKQKEWELKEAHRMRKVPLPGKWEENPDKYLLEMGGVKCNHAELIGRD
ncbi:uncharacterized protein LOC102808561 [Saccoglossus kowalevskii]|uniref:Uncharacterized protein LOC102808561 n=1 Tax=Saccoglossus kowalevskii TaxID=10224 RepID=A0ABM0M6U8_SACKO|nr:PREDICTED: uncharacterized protein LOC102808561 [Saccoglossus kowalevskii]